VAEQPPGSNDAPRIAEYRTATAGSGVGPWCAYFTSWVAQQAGVPVGPSGQGIGYVPTVRQWAESQGRYIPAGGGAPQVGDLVVFDRGGDGVLDHIGVVTGVRPDGGIDTVEGNSSDKVSARSYGPGGYAGLVRLT
jgi:cell wall-associated NlpC family hydrolase